MSIRDGKLRYSDRAIDYLKYRPCYPDRVIEILKDELQLNPGAAIADVGAGTGIFAQQLLNAGYEVFAIEPNHAMRDAACNLLQENDLFHCIAGAAEDTGLPDRQVELVTAAQSFHWFDVSAARDEFIRISSPPHQALLIWNHRKTEDTFENGMNGAVDEFLLRWCDEYETIRDTYLNQDRIREFFGNEDQYQHQSLDHCQILNWESLEGRLKSCSYCPGGNDPRFVPMLCDLRQLFDVHQKAGRVRLCYNTKIFVGNLESRPM